MTNIVEKLRSVKDLSAIKGCSITQIREAQEALNLAFPDEYIDYVKAFGCIDFGSTEWTGLNITGRLNTVDATKREQSVNPNFPQKCFVLEDLNIDAKKIIVNEEGKVFCLQYDKIKPLCNSISEYLDICIEQDK